MQAVVELCLHNVMPLENTTFNSNVHFLTVLSRSTCVMLSLPCLEGSPRALSASKLTSMANP